MESIDPATVISGTSAGLAPWREPWRLTLVAALILIPLLALRAYPSVAADCVIQDPMKHEDLGFRWDELLEKYRAYNQLDLRAQDQGRVLKHGFECLSQRLTALISATGDHADLDKTLKTSLEQTLDKITVTLQALERKTSVTVQVDVDPKVYTALSTVNSQLTAQIAVQNDLIRTLKLALSQDGGAVVSPSVIVNALSTASSAGAAPAADLTPRRQIDPKDPVADYYNRVNTRFDFALASIPDPRVPRHRRQYDNAVSAINQGMLAAGFVLDKFGFPWADDLLTTPAGVQKTTGNTDAASVESRRVAKLVVKDDGYGLMIFRRDRWRELPERSDKDVEIRALYLVTETGTYGTQPQALDGAIRKISSQLDAAVGASGKVLVLYGPSFSGSVNSIREEIAKLAPNGPFDSSLPHIAKIQLISPSGTAETNRNVEQSEPLKGHELLYYSSLARTDAVKIKSIEALAAQLGVDFSQVAIVYESTTFGIEACKVYKPKAPSVDSVCDRAIVVPFPVNIADVRYGLGAKAASQARTLDGKTPLPIDSKHLALEQGAENGSEFPESQQSSLTAAATELELDRIVSELERRHAKLVVVIATDVRDRLFLIDKFNEKLDGALFIDFGTDRLLGHQDFIHATRGTLTLASRPLSGNLSCIDNSRAVFQAWSTDEQAALACAIGRWTPTPGSVDDTPPVPYVVSRTGLVTWVDLTESWVTSMSNAVTLGVTILSCLGFALYGLYFCVTEERQGLLSAPRPGVGEALRVSRSLAAAALVIGVLWIVTRLPSVAILIGVAGFCGYYWKKDIAFQWPAAMMWLNTGLLVVTALSEGVSLFGLVFNANEPVAHWRSLRFVLSGASTGGMAYLVAQTVAAATMIATVLISRRIQFYTNMTNEVWEGAAGSDSIDFQRPWRRAGLTVAILGFAAAPVAVLLFWVLDVRQVTVFGRFADFSMFISLVATTLLAFCLLIGAVGAAGRINTLARAVKRRSLKDRNLDPDTVPASATQPLAWPNVQDRPAVFVATPVMANRFSAAAAIKKLDADPDEGADHLHALLDGPPVTTNGLSALSSVLSSEMANYQFAILGVAIATIASSTIVYLFPVTRATGLIAMNLLALIIAGGYSAYQVANFERDLVLSNVLCNRSQRTEWSVPFIASILIPFLVLAIAISIGQIPGVLDVGGGILETLWKWAKPGG